ncbi:MAG: type II toxin-antitoxin system PemK/MazF family toxin [Clostridia bacterium]|nr:type II toxin-antitoxin system PemK/MazF family toxin [Clostridia bacterium]
MNIKRGDIYYADLSPVIGSEQGGLRPVLIVQNDVGNKFSPTVIAAAITSKIGKTKLPTHIDVLKGAQGCMEMGLARDSVVLLEQIRTIDKRRLKERMGHLEDNVMQKVNAALTISFGLAPAYSAADNTQTENMGVSAVISQESAAAVTTTVSAVIHGT